MVESWGFGGAGGGGGGEGCRVGLFRARADVAWRRWAGSRAEMEGASRLVFYPADARRVWGVVECHSVWITRVYRVTLCASTA